MEVKKKGGLCLECDIRATFNIPGNTPRYCANHRKENMVNVVTKKCLECDKCPSFNIKGNFAIYCADHCKEGMVNVNSKSCLKCDIQPSFNLKGKSAAYCGDHKSALMVDVVSKKCRKCDKRANFNTDGNSPLYCFNHKEDNMINVTRKKCLECKITQLRGDNKYDGHCTRCFINLFPDKPVARNYKVKEKHVFDAVLSLLPKDLDITLDKRTGGCSRRRPDMMIDLGSHWICCENDENCHKEYNSSCENKRTMELYTDMGNRPMILIRFNCDKYSGGKSLFKTCKKTGISIINSKKDFNERILGFSEMIIKYILAEPPEKAITTEYLYYEDEE